MKFSQSITSEVKSASSTADSVLVEQGVVELSATDVLLVSGGTSPAGDVATAPSSPTPNPHGSW